jgi:hypothetical protein
MLTRQQQAGIVTDLMNAIRNGIIADITNGKIPETWDGHELRMLITERVTAQADAGRYMTASRKREYRNTVLVNNL